MTPDSRLESRTSFPWHHRPHVRSRSPPLGAPRIPTKRRLLYGLGRNWFASAQCTASGPGQPQSWWQLPSSETDPPFRKPLSRRQPSVCRSSPPAPALRALPALLAFLTLLALVAPSCWFARARVSPNIAHFICRCAVRCDPLPAETRPLDGHARSAYPPLDPLLHHSHVLSVTGESYRLREKRRADVLNAPAATAQPAS